jgi:RNA polymerase sigma factor (sigma-70 family)
MASTLLHSVLRHLRRIARPQEEGELSDVRLLGRFAHSRDEAAFEVLVRRHGPRILEVCRRLLPDDHDVEDAFQATFLALAAKAGSVGKRGSVGGWLYRVAHRIALATRAGVARRVRYELRYGGLRPPKDTTDPVEEAIRSESRSVLAAAVDDLPEKYRRPVVLCYLEGKSYEEAARQLGCPKGTLSIRLSRGRAMLRKRLAPRAAALSVGGLTANRAPGGVSPAVPREWLTAAVQGARVRTGQQSAGLASQKALGRASVWADRVIRTMAVARLKLAALFVSAVGVLLAGVTAVGLHMLAAPPGETNADDRPEGTTRSVSAGPERADAYGDPLPPGALARIGTVRLRHSQNINEVAFAPDGKTLAAGDWGETCLWDAATGKLIRRLPGGHGLAYSPEGDRLVTAAEPGFRVRDAATGRDIAQFRVRGDSPVQNLVLSPDGKLLAWLTQDNTLHLSDSATGKELLHWPGRKNVMPSSYAFSPDSRTVALACQIEKDVHLYDTTSGREVRRFVGHRETLYAVAISPDGKTLVSCARDDTLRYWDVATGKELRQVNHDGGVWRLAFSPDGTVLATGGGNARFWDAATGKLLRVVERDADGHIEALAFSPDGKTLAAARSNSHVVSLWDAASGKRKLTFDGHWGPVIGLAISPHGSLLASSAREKNYTRRNAVHLWDTASAKEVGTAGTDLGFASPPAFSADGKLLAAGNEDGTIRIWDAATRREMRRLKGHAGMFGNKEGMVEFVGFAPDGKVLVSFGYHDRVFRVWDVAEGKEVRHFNSSLTAPGEANVLTPDGKLIVQGGRANPSLTLWDVTAGKLVHQFADKAMGVNKVALSPDGRTVASAELNGNVVLRDVAGGKEVGQLQDANLWVNFVLFSPDGRTLASAGNDGVIRLRELATGAERCRLEGHRSSPLCGVFSPDGRKLFTGSLDTTILVWDVTGQVAQGGPGTKRLSQRELERLWSDLAAMDGPRSHCAIWTLTAAPNQAVSLIRERLRPAVAADPKRIAGLLTDLDSDSFATRDRATKELEKIGEAALPALRKAIEGGLTVEQRRRVDALMEGWTGVTPEYLYAMRAIEVLDHIGSPEANQLLKTLAEGLPEARLTREAKASIERRLQRPSVAP